MANKSMPSGNAKKPSKTVKEKKAAKRAKKESRGKIGKASIPGT